MMIETKNLILKQLKERDAIELAHSANHKEISEHTRVPYPYTLEDARDFIKEQKERFVNKEDIALGVFLKESGHLIGMLGIHHIHWHDARGDLGYWITPEYWRKGYGKEAVSGFVRYLFDYEEIHRIEIEIKPENTASISLAESLGAKKEGLLRKRCFTDNKRRTYHDVVLYGLLKEDFENKGF